MKGYLFALILMFSAMPLTAESLQQKYVKRYSDIAVEEMYRTGVPASITLAQGLLESGCGRSELALKSNNHFGIKCHNGWQGGKVYHDDDAKGECFRRYDRPEDSYRDHSDFLRYRDRYRFLFEYEITDYRAWAYGLKKAGYATDPAYPEKLIDLIEEYALSVYDTRKPVIQTGPRNDDRPLASQMTVPLPPGQLEQVTRLTARKAEEFHFSLSRSLYSQNDVPFVYSVEGETYRSIARSNNLFLKELLRFNDLTSEADLRPGTVVYLQKKKKQAAKGLEMHVVEAGETLRGISQRYGVRVGQLCKINGIKDRNVIREGDIIKLRKK